MDQPNRRYGVYNQQTGQMPPQQEQQYEQQSPTYKDPKKTSEMIVSVLFNGIYSID